MRTLLPQLVTGLKIWHLRPESSFYPKVNFENVMSLSMYTSYILVMYAVPEGSDIIFLLGEIDCREGFLVSVEKCKYEVISHHFNSQITRQQKKRPV